MLDFMIRSEITLVDENYSDPLHFVRRIAAEMVTRIADGVNTRQGKPGYFRYLTPDGAR